MPLNVKPRSANILEAAKLELEAWVTWADKHGGGGAYPSTTAVIEILNEALTAQPAEAGVTVKALPPQSLLQSMFDYDPNTGILIRKALSASHFPGCKDKRGAGWMASAYNARSAGKEAFTSKDRSGYFHGKVLGAKYQAHRIIWKLVYGTDPKIIDHINGNPSDNRIANLRDCSVADNSRNYRKPPGPSSKYRGVCWVKREQSWAARISANGKHSLGNFQDEVEAARAYDRAARELHGEFATLNFPDEV